MHANFLQYPSLCKDYIYLITEVLEYFPDRLKDLDAKLLSSLVKSLIFGMNHAIFEVGSSAFDAMMTLGLYAWFESTKKGADSLAFLAPHLDSLLQHTFHYILFEDFDSTLISHAGDSLFALVMARQDTFRILVEQVMQQQPHPGIKARLSKEFQDLTQVMIKIANLQHDAILQGRLSIGFGEFHGTKMLLQFKEYREQFFVFIMHVRGILRVK